MREAGLREEARYSRLKNVGQKLPNDEDGEPDLSDEAIRETAASLWKKMESTYHKVVKALQAVTSVGASLRFAP